MVGATLDELYEDLKENHEFVFDIHGMEYVIQPEVRNGDNFLVIYPWIEGMDCIAEQRTKSQISNDNIDAILSQKCFDGASFMDLLDEIKIIKEY